MGWLGVREVACDSVACRVHLWAPAGGYLRSSEPEPPAAGVLSAEGLDTVGAITAVPTFQPSDNMRYFNTFASVLGDDRSGKARAIWGKPIKAVVITRAAIAAAV